MRTVFLSGAALALACIAGCGGGADNGEATQNTSGQSQTEKAQKSSKKRATPKVDKGYSYQDYLNLSVVGLQPNMTIAEVKAALIENGFTPPPAVDRSQIIFNGHHASLGMDCENPKRRNPCRVGSIQEYARFATRIDDETGLEEQLLAFFYMDMEGVERLYSVKYIKPFADPIYPENMQDALIKRYGTPDNYGIDGDETEQELRIRYDMHTTLPNGESYDDVKVETLVRTLIGQDTAMKPEKTRLDCVKDRLEDYDAQITDWCKYLMGADPFETHMFFIATRDNRALHITVYQSRMEVEMIGRFIPEAYQSWQREKDYLAEIEELEERRNRKPDTLDDL